MGTPDFAVPTLEALIGAGHELAAVVTQPDKPKGRGKAVLMTPVKENALECSIPVYQPKRVREPEFLDVLRKLNPDVIVVVAFGQILRREILTLPPFGCVNVHASLLPKYRGAAPIQWAVIDGETVSGVTTMQMNEGLDTGDILEQEEISLDPEETGGSLFEKLASLGGKMILSTLKGLEDGSIIPRAQGEMTTPYAKMLTKAMGEIDWSMDAASIERLVRGLNPWPSAYTYVDGKTLKIWKARVEAGEAGNEPGQVRVTKDRLLVETENGVLSILELQLEGKKRMEAAAFLRGFSIETGRKFGRS